MINLMANSEGPKISLDHSELNFNDVPVLEDRYEKIKIKSMCDIDAEYTAFTKNKESIWKVQQRHGILKPGEEKTIDIVCNADEVQKFSDVLHIIINNGDDKEV